MPRILGSLRIAVVALALLAAGQSYSAEIGRIKVSKGAVTVERQGAALTGEIGLRLEPGDVLKTGRDSSVGITMSDNSILSAGPNSILSLDRYEFNPVTYRGRFDARLDRGSLSVISGKIAKEAPDAMTVRTPAAILGVRGTEFVVSSGE